MKFAIQTPPERTSFEALADLWAAADELGFWGAFTFDHLVSLGQGRPSHTEASPTGPQFEGWIVLAGLAARTTRLRVGTLVTGVTYRHPAVLAKMAVTLDHMTGGRAILGVGAAWHEEEHRMFGIPFPPVGDRMSLLEETLAAFRLLTTQDVTNYEGRHVRLRDAVFEPKPVRPAGIPVLVGGTGDRLKRIAAQHADIFDSFPPPREWPAVNRDLDEKLAAQGRRAQDLLRSGRAFAELSGDPDREARLVDRILQTRGGTEEEVRRRVLVGSGDDMIGVVKGYEAAGVDIVTINMLAPFEPAGLERFALDVLPAFAE